jgi:hypothetical protein
MTNIAIVKWNDTSNRYELIIDGVLKAYANWETHKEIPEGKKQLVKLAEDNGYHVHVEK